MPASSVSASSVSGRTASLRAGGPGSVHAARRSAAGQSDADRAVTDMYQSHYRQLVRLAVLLAGDLGTAEEIVQDAFADMHGAWRWLGTSDAAAAFLRRAVVARSRSVPPDFAATFPVAPQYPDPQDPGGSAPLRPVVPPAAGAGSAAGSGSAAAAGAGPADDQPAIIPALRKLVPAQREALVLRLYLDLDEDQIAAATQASRAAVAGHLQAALAALQDVV
jgi:DNA-directed RNA polymerase specialized sigma24 family protein